MQANAAAGFPPQPESHVFLQLTGGGYKLTDKAATYAVVARVVKLRAATCGLAHMVLTGHRSRRGHIQQDKDEGLAADVTCARLLGISAQTYSLYADKTRPTRRLAAPVGAAAGPSVVIPSHPGGVTGLVHRTLTWFTRD